MQKNGVLSDESSKQGLIPSERGINGGCNKRSIKSYLILLLLLFNRFWLLLMYLRSHHVGSTSHWWLWFNCTDITKPSLCPRKWPIEREDVKNIERERMKRSSWFRSYIQIWRDYKRRLAGCVQVYPTHVDVQLQPTLGAGSKSSLPPTLLTTVVVVSFTQSWFLPKDTCTVTPQPWLTFDCRYEYLKMDDNLSIARLNELVQVIPSRHFIGCYHSWVTDQCPFRGIGYMVNTCQIIS